MSLTSMLDERESWVRLFLQERCCELGRTVARIRSDVKALETDVPLHSARVLARTVGKAFDYRLRLHLGLRPSESNVLQAAVRRLTRGRALLEAPLPVGEAGLALVSVVLAWLDDLYRLNAPPDGMVRPGGSDEERRYADLDGMCRRSGRHDGRRDCRTHGGRPA